MEAVIVAMGILMWMWGAASLRLVQLLLTPAAGATRSAWLALALAVGAGGLVALALLVLPTSVLSQGWSRETLQSAQTGTEIAVVALALAALWRGHRQLAPFPGKPVPATPVRRPPARSVPADKAKKRP